MNRHNKFSQAVSTKEQNSKRILIIENSESLGTLYKSILLQSKYTILSTSCGKDALEMLESFRPDLIITPENLSDMDSAELRSSVNSRIIDTYLPILVLSAQKKPSLFSHMPKLKLDETLFLPFKIADLRNVVQKLLGSYETDTSDFYYPGNQQDSYFSKQIEVQSMNA